VLLLPLLARARCGFAGWRTARRRDARAGTGPVVLAAGLAEALRLCDQRLLANGASNRSGARDRLGCGLCGPAGVSLSDCPQRRLPPQSASWWQMTRRRLPGRFASVSGPLSGRDGGEQWHGLSSRGKPGAARCWPGWDTAEQASKWPCGSALGLVERPGPGGCSWRASV